MEIFLPTMIRAKRVLIAVLVLCATIFCAASDKGGNGPKYKVPLATGRRIDAVGESIELGSMPASMILSPDSSRLIVVLSGWREQGIQVVDLAEKRVTQTLKQEAAFFGAALSPDGKHLYVSGSNEDVIYCYSWARGAATFDRKIVLGNKKQDGTGSKYPAGLAVSRNGRYLYVAENVANDLAVVDAGSGETVQRFPTDRYPYAIAASSSGDVYVSAWDGDTVSMFHAGEDGRLVYLDRIAVGRHPSALLLNGSGSRLFIALDSMDVIAVLDTARHKIIQRISDRGPAGPAEGSTPDALALSFDGLTLYVAEADNNAVAVIALSAESAGLANAKGADAVIGRIPSDWYPTGVLAQKGKLLVLNGKGHGSHANPDGPVPARGIERPLGYALGLLNGSLRTIPQSFSKPGLAGYSRRVAAANGWNGATSRRHYPPFKHVIYIIKENRTYDQVLGDLKQGDGDPSLVFFGEDVSPNHHALALRFGNFDRFFTNAEVSSQGHIWSTAAYVTNYGERVIPSIYSDRRADNDEDDVDAPANGFLWDAAMKHGISFRDYGEWVKSKNGFTQTRPGLGPDISPDYPVFSYDSRDQRRADVWISEFKEFVRSNNMPQLEIMHLPMDHTAGGMPGMCTPRACMADNDMALGRIVEALSNSPRWADTVIFVVEDDAQAGPDHVDCHRAPFYVISAYNRPGVTHRFVNTTDVVAAIEDILGLNRLSQFDYFSRPLSDVFAATPDLSPYKALVPRQSIEEKNPDKTPAARISMQLDFSAPDRIDDDVFNDLLWMMLKPNQPKPQSHHRAPLHALQTAR